MVAYYRGDTRNSRYVWEASRSSLQVAQFYCEFKLEDSRWRSKCKWMINLNRLCGTILNCIARTEMLERCCWSLWKARFQNWIRLVWFRSVYNRHYSAEIWHMIYRRKFYPFCHFWRFILAQQSHISTRMLELMQSNLWIYGLSSHQNS
jgi:hypothetical protein